MASKQANTHLTEPFLPPPLQAAPRPALLGPLPPPHSTRPSPPASQSSPQRTPLAPGPAEGLGGACSAWPYGGACQALRSMMHRPRSGAADAVHAGCEGAF
jgi:hypothetical protein